MTRDVLIRISGLRTMDGDQEDVEMITTGEYYWRNNKHYVFYDEVVEGFEGSIRNMIKITPAMMQIRKQGLTSADMVFEQGQKKMARYITPIGEMVIEIGTSRIQIDTQEDHLKVSVNYGLDINYEHVSDSSICLDVSSLDKAQLSLRS